MRDGAAAVKHCFFVCPYNFSKLLGCSAALPTLPCPALQVLDEIGVDLGSQLSAAPKQRLSVAQKQQEQEQQPELEEDLLASRLAALK